MKTRDGSEETGAGAEDERLLEMLRDLVRTQGRAEAADLLGVSTRTLQRTLASGRLTVRMRDALELRRLSEGTVPAHGREEGRGNLEERVQHLEDRLGALADELRSRLEGIRGTVGAQSEERTGEGAQVAPPAAVKGVGQQVIGQPATSRPWRPYPQLVTLEPEVGEEQVYGAAMPTVLAWRQARSEVHTSRRRLERLDAERRALELELTLIGDHELTLPPAVYPWDRFDRRDEVWRREQSLEDLRAERSRALVVRWVRRVLTLGVWWR